MQLYEKMKNNCINTDPMGDSGETNLGLQVKQTSRKKDLNAGTQRERSWVLHPPPALT